MIKPLIFASALLAAAASASEIVYNKGSLPAKAFRPKRNKWPMSFYWPRQRRGDKNSFRCTATMISPTVAITAAHCVNANENRVLPENRRLWAQRFTKKGWAKITEIRVSDCWEFRGFGKFA